MNVAQLAEQLRRDTQFMKDVTRWEVIPAREPRTLPFPSEGHKYRISSNGRIEPFRKASF